ncbi:hypothetical protein TNCV_436511 [Trichonephila clavipes]|nr:hypothetical protein TNCV_436511 [Trichonephila clavipes]
MHTCSICWHARCDESFHLPTKRSQERELRIAEIADMHMESLNDCNGYAALCTPNVTPRGKLAATPFLHAFPSDSMTADPS